MVRNSHVIAQFIKLWLFFEGKIQWTRYCAKPPTSFDSRRKIWILVTSLFSEVIFCAKEISVMLYQKTGSRKSATRVTLKAGPPILNPDGPRLIKQGKQTNLFHLKWIIKCLTRLRARRMIKYQPTEWVKRCQIEKDIFDITSRTSQKSANSAVLGLFRWRHAGNVGIYCSHAHFTWKIFMFLTAFS